MTIRRLFTACFSAAAMIVLILDGQTALTGALKGTELCLKTVIPSLFPFLFLCSALTSALWGQSYPWLHPLTNILGIPRGGESLLLAGILGGYPAGAQVIGEAYHDERLSESDATHLLSFCSNSGPAFLFGVASHSFSEIKIVCALWIIQLLSSFFTGILGMHRTSNNSVFSPKTVSLSELLARSIITIYLICGWIVLFQILKEFIQRWFLWYFPEEIQVFVTGLLELSSGCSSLSNIESDALRFLICSVLLSFGGICVTMQTVSIIHHLSIKSYLRGKGLQTIISLFLSVMYLILGWIFLAVTVLLILIFIIYRKKELDFHTHPVYNSNTILGRKIDYAVSKKN